MSTRKKTSKKQVVSPQGPTASQLKNLVWETMNQVATNTIDPKRANSITSGCNSICGVVRLELQVQKMVSKKPNGNITRFITGRKS